MKLRPLVATAVTLFACAVSAPAISSPRQTQSDDGPEPLGVKFPPESMMWHLRYDDGEYVGGYVYNPEDGVTYRVEAKVLSPESLKIRGFLGISLFGQTKTWSRFQ